MRQGLMSVAMALWASTAGAQMVAPVPNLPAQRHILAVHVGGRVVTHALPAGGTEYEHQWPGVYFESRFKGTRAYLAFNDTLNEYRLIVDDGTPITLNPPGKRSFEIGGLRRGTHTLRLEKVTESQGLSGAFDGFSIPADEKALTVPPRARQMEFIGDSSMTGYGDRSTTTKCSGDEWRSRSDTQQDYTALTAKHYNADYQINAVSGRGLIRNLGGFYPDISMSHIYPNALIDGAVPYEDPNWQPQIIVVKLNADFFGDLKPGEPWATQQALRADYLKAQEAFATLLHKRYPDAAILLWAAAEKDIKTPEDAKRLEIMQMTYANAAHRIGIAHFGFVPYSPAPEQSTGCDGHDSLTDQKNDAKALIDYIDAHPELWRTTAGR
jgi:hypothetical protein